MLGDGERACMSMARFGQEVIASSNFRDVAPYCDENGIIYWNAGCADYCNE